MEREREREGERNENCLDLLFLDHIMFVLEIFL